MSLPRASTIGAFVVLMTAIALGGNRGVLAQDPAGPEAGTMLDEGINYASLGLRFGAFDFTENDLNDALDMVPLLGVDAKLHVPHAPLAAQTSFDVSFGSAGDLPDTTDYSATLFSWRLTALLEPPPRAWGTKDGKFYVMPYVGGGVGVHVFMDDLQVKGEGSSVNDESTDAVFGLHAVVGVDFVIAEEISMGAEFMYTWTTEANTSIGDVEVGGIGVAGAIKVHF